MYSLNTIPVVGMNFGFKAALAFQGGHEVRNIDFRNALRFFDVMLRQGCLASERDIKDVTHQIAAHICQSGTYRPLVMFAQYSVALTNIVKFMYGSCTDMPKVVEMVRRLLSVVAKAKHQAVSLYEHGDASVLSVFVQREFQRGTCTARIKGWAGLNSYYCAAQPKLGRGTHLSEDC